MHLGFVRVQRLASVQERVEFCYFMVLFGKKHFAQRVKFGPPPFFFAEKAPDPRPLTPGSNEISSADEKRPTATKTRAHRPLFEVVLPKNKAAKLARRVSRRAKPTSSGRARGREGTKKNQLRFDRFPLNPTCAPTTPIKKKDERAIFARDEKKKTTHSGRGPRRRTRRRARGCFVVVATTRSSRPVSFAGHARKTWCLCVLRMCVGKKAV